MILNEIAAHNMDIYKRSAEERTIGIKLLISFRSGKTKKLVNNP